MLLSVDEIAVSYSRDQRKKRIIDLITTELQKLGDYTRFDFFAISKNPNKHWFLYMYSTVLIYYAMINILEYISPSLIFKSKQLSSEFDIDTPETVDECQHDFNDRSWNVFKKSYI